MQRSEPITELSGEFDRTAVATAWQAFTEQRSGSTAPVRELIVDSWRRSLAQGIAPDGPCAPLAGDQTDLAERLAANRELLVAADHTWQLLAESLMASDNVFVVADAAGVILEVRGNGEFVEAAAEQHVGPGHDWSETASGTNAIGTALILDRPTIVRWTEHFCTAAKIWDCAAAPIRDLADGSLLGILDVTSAGDLSDSHTLALAVTAAHQIEHTLHAQDLARSVQLLNWYRTVAARWTTRPALLLDRKGQIVRASDPAQALIGTQRPRISLRNHRPVIVDSERMRLVDTLAYRPPADFRAVAEPDAWHGGVVLVEFRPDSGTATGSDPASRYTPHPAFRRIVTADPGLTDTMRRAERMARANSPILLQGETGSGKELFAQAIHECSSVSSGPFVAVNCGTLTRELAASELLGYESGAFTGAVAGGRAGKFEQADGGTLFLDEIGELPADVQVNLLRVLQDNVVVRVGGSTTRTVNVRIVAATHRDLDRDAEDGRFRSDLLFRLRVLSLTLSPLRERRGDIALLVLRFLERLQASYGLGARTVSPKLLEQLTAYAWPGNVRELQGLLESLYILSERPMLTVADLPVEFAATAAGASPSADAIDAPLLGRVERDTIIESIATCRNNMTDVARRLGISRSTLYRKLRQYNIDR